MTKQKEPTLKQLLQTVYTKQGEHDALLKGILDQAKRTNGRVTEVERWQSDKDSREKAIEDYEARSQPAHGAQGTPLSPLEKKLIAIIMALITLVGTAIATGKVG